MDQFIHRFVRRRRSAVAASIPLLLALALFVVGAAAQGGDVPAPAAGAPFPALNPAGWKQLTIKSGKLRFQDFTAGGESFVALAPDGGFGLYATATCKELRRLGAITLENAASFKFLPAEQEKNIHYLVGSEREIELRTWADHRQVARLQLPLRDSGINLDGENPRWSADGKLLGTVQQMTPASRQICDFIAYEVTATGFKETLRTPLTYYSGGIDLHAGRGLLAYKSSPPLTGGIPAKMCDSVILYDVAHKKTLWERHDLPLGSGCVRFSPDGSTLAVCAGEWVLLVDTDDAAKLRIDRQAAESCLQWADFSRDGRTLVTASQNSAISFYPADFSAPEWRPLKTIALGTMSNIYYLKLFDNDRRVLCNTAGSVRVFGAPGAGK